MTRHFLDTAIERTVVPSFSSIGAHLRRRLFDWPALESFDLIGRTVVLTGGTSGIGEAAASLYATLGATLVIVARNEDKTAKTVASLVRDSGNRAISSVIADLGDLGAVRRAAGELAERHPRIDVLAHNAGALFNERKRTDDGTDLLVELMVAAPFLMTGLLLPSLRRGAQQGHGAARVLTMSSGGMYTEALTVDDLQMPDADYHGVKQYARAKRAQVTLNELWAARIPPSEIVFQAMHPGWVDTPGITDALPGFSKVLGPVGMLRSPREGADTLVWLSAADEALHGSGDFWHDRGRRSAHMLDLTRKAETPQRHMALWQWCEAHTGFELDSAC